MTSLLRGSHHVSSSMTNTLPASTDHRIVGPTKVHSSKCHCGWWTWLLWMAVPLPSMKMRCQFHLPPHNFVVPLRCGRHGPNFSNNKCNNNKIISTTHFHFLNYFHFLLNYFHFSISTFKLFPLFHFHFWIISTNPFPLLNYFHLSFPLFELFPLLFLLIKWFPFFI